MKIIIFTILLSLNIAIPAHAEMYDVVGTELPPLMYQESGISKGFYVDILQSMIQNLENTDVKIEFFPAPRMFKTLSENSNCFSLGVTRNEKREELYKWVGPIYPRIFALYKLKNRHDIKVKELKEVIPYKVGCGRGYAAVNDLLNAGIPKENIEEVTNDSQNINKLFENRIDFIIMNDVMLSYLLEKYGHKLNEVEQVLILNDKYEFWFAFNKNIDDSIIQKFQNSLDQIKQDGRYEKIVKKYFK